MAQHKGVAAETSEAMARWFRPIAPKPMPSSPLVMPAGALQRARKRGREDYRVPSSVSKRERDVMFYPQPPVQHAGGDGKTPIVTRGWHMPEMFSPSCEERLGRLSFAGSTASSWALSPNTRWLFPIERDLISKLQAVRVIKPYPTRSIRTTISINTGNFAGATNTAAAVVSKKTVREVEAELELPDVLPAIVSGHDNSRVHLANDAYKAMVGQPVCPWLDSLRGTGTSRRINGEVVLDVQAFSALPYLPSIEGGAFPCTARISWERAGAVASLTVPCAVERLTGNCNSVDYCFIWRFESRRASIIYDIA